MSVTREARHLSGNDLGKTITAMGYTSTIASITHAEGYARIYLNPPAPDGTHTVTVRHDVTVTITGQPSPPTNNPHGAVMFTKYDPETRRVHIDIAPNQTIASLYRTTEKWVKDNTPTPIPAHLRPLGFTTVDEALGTPQKCPCFGPPWHGHYDPACPDYCDRCNYDNHICPGCGDPLRHGTNVCPDCVTRLDEKVAEQENITDYGPECCIGECCGPGSYCCSHPANKHSHDDEPRPPALPVPADKPVAHPPAIPVYNVGYHGTRLDTRFVAGMYRVPAHDGEAARAIVRRRLKEQGLKDVGIEYTTRQDRP